MKLSARPDNPAQRAGHAARIAGPALPLRPCGFRLLLVSCLLASLGCARTGELTSPPPSPDSTRPEGPTAFASKLVLGATAGVVGAAQPPARLRLVFLSDLNERYGDACYEQPALDAIARVRELEPDLVVFAGDLVAGQKKDLDYDGMWAAFERDLFARLEGLPAVTTPGNHDASGYPKYQAERDTFVRVWNTLPRADAGGAIEMVDASAYPLRYSFAIGPLFVVALDTTHRDALDDAQIDWLAAQLASPRAAACPLVMVLGHLPLFPLTVGREKDALLSDPIKRERVAELFRSYPVELYVSGHHHGFYPGVSPLMPTRLIGLGCLGGGPRRLLGDPAWDFDPASPSARSLLVVDLEGERIRRIDALAGPSFDEASRIDWTTLPQSVGSGDTLLLRLDLALGEH